jgi:hypothetical protein
LNAQKLVIEVDTQRICRATRQETMPLKVGFLWGTMGNVEIAIGYVLFYEFTIGGLPLNGQ